MRHEERGFSAVLLSILVLAFLAVPAYYWVSNDAKDDFSPLQNVKGASVDGSTSGISGFSVSVVSDSSTWDLVEYLCKTADECLSSLTAGRRLGTVSGGATDLHEVVVEYSPEWQEYDYIKYYVRSGWYSSGKLFKVDILGDLPGSSIHELNDGGDIYNVVLSPVTAIQDSFYDSARFTNR